MDRRTHLKPPYASFHRERQTVLLLYRAEVVAAFGMGRGGNDSDRSPARLAVIVPPLQPMSLLI